VLSVVSFASVLAVTARDLTSGSLDMGNHPEVQDVRS
jgi:hypothetical protein